MGIPRLTQDLRPYLETIVLGTSADSEVLQSKDIVIDGPSMVYHVYNQISIHRLNQPHVSSVCDVSTYRQLNRAVACFLGDIEACGVSIKNIFFDGALPVGKRGVRADRLEKSRHALELQRIAYPNLKLSDFSSTASDDSSIRKALWPKDSLCTPRSLALSAPFIVPSVLDFLAYSRWAPLVALVPGEADSFCASAAQSSLAAVLTNDSDLTLFGSRDKSATVVLLYSLMLYANDNPTLGPRIQGQCWRPGHIAKQFDVISLSYFGYARSRDATASFNTILQQSKEIARNKGSTDSDVSKFMREYETTEETLESQQGGSLRLNGLDPRLAELLCQISGSSKDKSITSSNDVAVEVHISLSSLLEDPNRDTAWSYGREYRRIAYFMLIEHATAPEESQIKSSSRSFRVIEHIRKGPKIVPSVVEEIYDPAKCNIISKLLLLMNRYQGLSAKLFIGKAGCDSSLPTMWLVLAIHLIWQQRNLDNKRSFSANLLAHALGLTPIQKDPVNKASTDTSTTSWDLLHLSANVHAVLYSIRILKMSLDYIRAIKLSSLGATREGSPESALAALYEGLQEMPSIEHLFLTPVEIRHSFRTLPRATLTVLLSSFAQEFDLFEALGLQSTVIHSNMGSSISASSECKAKGGKSVEISNRDLLLKKRKRRKKESEVSTTVVSKYTTHNPFDALQR